jgi:hypothetical protein
MQLLKDGYPLKSRLALAVFKGQITGPITLVIGRTGEKPYHREVVSMPMKGLLPGPHHQRMKESVPTSSSSSMNQLSGYGSAFSAWSLDRHRAFERNDQEFQVGRPGGVHYGNTDWSFS